MTFWASFLAAGGEYMCGKKGGYVTSKLSYPMQTTVRVRYPTYIPAWLTHTLDTRASSIVLSEVGTRPTLSSAVLVRDGASFPECHIQ